MIEKYMLEPANPFEYEVITETPSSALDSGGELIRHKAIKTGYTKLELGALIIASGIDSNSSGDYLASDLAGMSTLRAAAVLKSCHDAQKGTE